jgi:membrane fusion protein (multidrug efflux system)
MHPTFLTVRRTVTIVMLGVALVTGGAVGLSEMGANIFPPPIARKIHVCLGSIGAGAKRMKGYIVRKFFQKREEGSHEEQQTIVVTSPTVEDVVVSQPYVCQIRSQRNIEVRALEGGYLDQILVREGQAVKRGDLMFKVVPTLYQAKLDSELAEKQLAELELNYSKQLSEKNVISPKEVLLLQAKVAKAQAKAKLAGAELNFTNVVAPFDGIVDRLREQKGSLVNEGDVLTTLSDNSVMWVYFNVNEARYLEYMASLKRDKDDQKIELELANHSLFLDGKKRPQHPTLVTVEGQFNNQTGTIPFRADFPNPEGVLRHGQTGTVWIHRMVHDALVIPQRATFEILDKIYVWVVGEGDVAHQRLITVKNVLDDIFVIDSGLEATDKIVLEGVRQVQDGRKVEFEFRKPQEALKNQKFHAE